MVTLSDDVINAAKSAMNSFRVPASVTLAQYGLESGWGQHMPVDSNNPFGIKARPDDPYVSAYTKEYVNGQYESVEQKFRKFDTLEDAFKFHAQLLAEASVYSDAMAALPNVTNFVVAMARHYATDPEYAHKVLVIIFGDKFTQYDGAD